MALQTKYLYPDFAINRLRQQHTQRWMDLVDWVARLPYSDPQAIAFTLTVRRVHACSADTQAKCPTPATCALCAADTLHHFEGSEQELLNLYYRNLDEVRFTMEAMKTRKAARRQVRIAA
jgi:hypothetical protein